MLKNTPSVNLGQAAKKVANFFFWKIVKTKEPNLKAMKRIQGIRLFFLSTFLFFEEKEAEMQKIPIKELKKISEDLSPLAISTNRCCAKQDFYLYPYKQFLLEKNLSFRKVVDWKIIKNLSISQRIRQNVSPFFSAFWELQKNHIVLPLSIDEAKDQMQTHEEKNQWELTKPQKEERHFHITRITDYHI